MKSIAMVKVRTAWDWGQGWLGAAIATFCLGVLPAIAQPTAPQPEPGVVEPHCVDQSQTGLNICAAHWLKTAEYLESLVYDDLYRQLTVADRLQLSLTEEYWRAYRQAQCYTESDLFSGGSIQSMIYGRCMAQLTNQRIADLQNWEADQPLSLEAAEAQMQQLLQALNQSDSDSQQYWEDYRESHCGLMQSLAMEDEAEFDLDVCQSRLAQARSDRLEIYQSWVDN